MKRHEPFYQLFRQQLLAHEMELHHELGAESVSVLHVSPSLNTAFLAGVTSPYLREHYPCENVTGIWAKLVRPKDRFASISTEELFGSVPPKSFAGMEAWQSYMLARYPRLMARP